jgi:outer membrane protein assembly complex protein YaeT
MRGFARRLGRLLAIVLALSALAVVLIHTPPVKRAAGRAAVALLERSLGGTASLEDLDYRLWRGEIGARGLRWSSDGISIEAREIRIEAALRGLSALRLVEPNVHIAFAGGTGPSGAVAIPALALQTRIEASNGSVRLEWPAEGRVLELSSVEASLIPEGASSQVSLQAATGRLREGDFDFDFGPARARLDLRAKEAVLEEARLEKEGSSIAAQGTVGPFSPLTAEIRFQHVLEASLLSSLDARVELDAPLEGEGLLRRIPGAEDAGEGTLRTSAVSFQAIGPFAAEVRWRFTGDRGSAEVSFESSDRARIPMVASHLSGDLALTIERWDPETLRGEGTVRARERREGPGLPLRGDVAVRLEAREVTFAAPRVVAPGAELSASGRVGEVFDVRYQSRLTDLRALSYLGIPESPVPLAGSLSIEGTVEGPLEDPRLESRIADGEIHLGERAFAVEGRGGYRAGRIDIQSLRLTGGEGSIALSGSLPASSGAGGFDLTGAIEDLRLTGLHQRVVSGVLDGSLMLTGTRARPEIQASFTTSDLATADGIRADLFFEARSVGLAGEGLLAIRNATFRDKALPPAEVSVESDGKLARLEARLDDGPVAASAQLRLSAPYPLEAEARFENLPIPTILALLPLPADTEIAVDVEGGARLEGTLSNLESLRYRADVEQFFGIFRGIALGASSPFAIEGTLAGFSVTDLTLVGEDTAIGIDGVVPLSRDGPIVLHARGATRLELLRPWFPQFEPEGRANVDVRVEGALPDPWIRGELAFEEVGAHFGGLRVANVFARADWNDRALLLESLEGETLGGRFQAEGELPSQLDAPGPVQVRFSATDVRPLGLISNEEGSFLQDADLRVAFDGTLRGAGTDLRQWQGEGTLASVRGALRGVEIENEAPGAWTFENGAIALRDFRMASGESRLALEGEARPLDSPISWKALARGTVALELSRIFLADLGIALNGTAEVEARAEKAGGAPLHLEGRSRFANARLVVRDPPIVFTNLTGEIALSESALSLSRLSADAGGGKVEAEGSVGIVDGGIGAVDLRATARSLRLNYPEGLRSEVEGSLRLNGDPDRLRLTGDVGLARALLSRDISLETELLQAVRGVGRPAESASSFASSVELDLRVNAAEAFRIDNNLARMEASVTATVGGTLAAPQITGIASVRPGGRFRFGDNEYRVETGRIVLRGYPASPPELDIAARTSVGQYDIRLVLRGTTDNLSTELTSESDPNLTRGDIASLLITGRTLSEVSDATRDVVATRMVSYLGATLADLAKVGIGESLPFEIVTVEPSLIAGEADPGARFTLGARFEDLSVVYSIGLDDAESQFWVVDYQLPRRTRTQVVRDEHNEYTLGLSQEIRFDLRDRSRAEPPRQTIAAARVVMEEHAPAEVKEEAERLLRTKPGDRFDYWKVWERAEKVRGALRKRGHLEALVDVSTSPTENGGVDVEYRVQAGPRVRFEFPEDPPDGSLEDALVSAWTGDASDSFLVADLANLATGRLFEDGWFTATAEVVTERTESELVVRVFLNRGPRGEKVVLDFTGNEAVPDSSLLAALPKLRSAEFHDLLIANRARLKQILSLHYASLGYVAADIADPEAGFDGASGEYRVTIPITEGPLFRVGALELEAVSPEDEVALRSHLSLREDEPFRVQEFVQARTAIATFYRDRGFAQAEVEASVAGMEGRPAEVAVRFVVRTGPRITVASVEVEGNQSTRESVIRREVKLSPGEPLALSELRETERGLYELGIFQSAEVVVEDPAEPDLSDISNRAVRVRVVETEDLELDYGGRASTDGFFEVLTELRATNVFGRAQHVGLRALLGSERQIFRFTYHTPYFSRYKLDTDFFVERSFEREGEAPFDFVDRRWTFTAQQTRLLKKAINAQWSYTFRRTVTDFTEDFDPLSNNQSLLTGSLIGDNRDSLVRPRRGKLWLATAQLSPKALGSELTFTKFLGQLFWHVPLRGGLVWASGYRLGVAHSFGQRLDIQDGFRAGGPNSVRGFEQDSLGPSDFIGEFGGGGLAVFNQEIRVPLFWRIRGVGFYDAGNAFESASDLRLSELRQSVGAGLRLDVPFGLLRLDWAAAIDPRPGEDRWRLIFSLGEAF